MPTTANSITYFVAADGTLRDGEYGSIPQQPRLNYGTDYAVTLSFPPSTIAEGDRLQVALNRTRTFFSSASATGDAPVAAVVKHDVTAEEAAAQTVEVVLSTNTRAMIDQVNGIDHPVRGFFGVHVLRGQSFVTLAVADALMLSLESGPDAISPSLPVVDYPTREEAVAIKDEALVAAGKAKEEADRAEEAAAGIVPPLQLSSPPTTSTVGSVGQLAVYHDSATGKDHLYHLCFVSEGESATLYHWEECVLLGSDGKIASNLLRIPIAGFSPYNNPDVIGGFKLQANDNYGLNLNTASGNLVIASATSLVIDSRNSVYRPIVPDNLDYAVRSVLPLVTEIPSATSDYSLVDSSATTNNHSHVYSHSPTAVPTYRLPRVTDTTISHYIELTVDFTAVQTYSFLDYAGEPIVPLFTPSIMAGDVYTFKMEYSAIKGAWLIYPQKQGAVADDFVMRGEVGAANGVAGLDGNAVVPINQLPTATNTTKGIVNAHTSGFYGIKISSGMLLVDKASSAEINERIQGYKPIVPNNLNSAVTAAITDAKHITLTDAQKATAQSVFGVGGPITAIPAATSAYTLAEGIFTHAPTSAPTYTLPNITGDIRTHEVVLIIDFSSVQTFSFLVDGGGDVTFQSYANPTMGDVWAFRCWWYGGKWRIAPTKIKNCVTRQLANGSLAITDAVAGDALALKMVAPRSVVVNQLIQNGNFSDGTNNWSSNRALLTVVNEILNMTIDSVASSVSLRQSFSAIIGHVYIVRFVFNTPKDSSGHLRLNNISTTAAQKSITGIANTNNERSWIVTGVECTALAFYPISQSTSSFANGDVIKVLSVQIVDLTQYFNGDQTLIDSIASWDDLVAYDPRFAQYVAYNTGEVVGVQPTVKATGKNLFDKNASLTNGYLRNDGSKTGDSAWAISDYIPVRQGMLITSSYPSGGGSIPSICFYDKDKQFISGIAHGNDLTHKTYTAPSGCCFVRDSFKDSDLNTFQLELGSTATSYEPYHDGGTTQAPAPLFAVGNAADEFEAVGGVTTERIVYIDLATVENWYFDQTRQMLRGFIPGACRETPYRLVMISSGKYTSAQMYTAGILPDKCCELARDYDAPNTMSLLIRDTDYTDKSTFVSSLAGTMLYYELATPTTSQSTPAQISLQAGSNVAMQTDGVRLAPIDITYESDEL